MTKPPTYFLIIERNSCLLKKLSGSRAAIQFLQPCAYVIPIQRQEIYSKQNIHIIQDNYFINT